WVACNRPAYLQEASVAPGQEGHFVFQFQAPFKVGTYSEAFKPVAEFLTWFNNDPNETFTVTVVSPGTYSWTTTGYTITNPSGNTQYDPSQLQPGQQYLATLEARNTGTATWLNNGPIPVTLGMPISSSLCSASWVACNRPAYLTES